jgi:hypothetical protein
MLGAYRGEMLPAVSTRTLLTAIETKRREEAARRWNESFLAAHSGYGGRAAAIRRSSRT